MGGRYRLVAPIARGGMAEVWEAHDEKLSRDVAAKVLQAHLASEAVFLERFRREAVNAARLAHPGIVATFDTGVDDGTAFIVMELVRGRNLRQVLSDNGALEPWQAVAVARQMADALAYAHQAGLVHRDIKPANVLLVEDEAGGLRVKVTDFGIAKAGAGIDQDLTRTGTVLGTPKYLSPEQIRGEEPDARADLYSLGVVLYEMLVGAPPFAAETDMATALSHLNNPVPKPSARVQGLPPELEQLVCDLLAKDPDKRVPSAVALRDRLDALGPLAPGRRGSPPAGRSALRESGGDNGGPVPNTTILRDPRRGAPPTVVSPVQGLRSPSYQPGSNGPHTDEFQAARHGPGRYRSAERTAGIVVLALLLIGALVAGAVYLSEKHRSTPPGRSAGTSGAAVHIASVTVYMVGDRQPDDPQGTVNTYDGNPSTFWSTDHYSSPTFGNLYAGIGLSVELSSSTRLSQLVVTSSTDGWSASVFVSSSAVPSGQPVSAWGSPVDSKSSITGDATFSLGHKTGRYVLLFITNLGPADQASINELTVH